MRYPGQEQRGAKEMQVWVKDAAEGRMWLRRARGCCSDIAHFKETLDNI